MKSIDGEQAIRNERCDGKGNIGQQISRGAPVFGC
jgi:hypothetical protein